MTDQHSLRVATIGIGYLGQYHAEKYHQNPLADLVAICDINQSATQTLAQTLGTQAVTDYQTLIGQVDAVSIVTPTPTHFDIAQFFLKHGVHVLIEKPITTTVEQADILIALAKEKNCCLQVGHLERFNNAIKAMEPMLDNPRFIESRRLAPFQLRGSDVNVILDLMIHDIDIIQHLVQSDIKHIAATGAAVLSPRIDIGNAHIEFENGCVANVTASRLNLKKVRLMHIFQHDAYYELNLNYKRVTRCFKGNNPDKPEILSDGIMYPRGDALAEQIQSFLNAIIHQTPPLVDGEAGRRALDTAMQITRIIRNRDQWNFHQ